MSLQTKFRLLLAVFGISIMANVLVSVWCIQAYLGGAVTQFRQHMDSANEVGLTRSQLDQLMRSLAAYATDPHAEPASSLLMAADDVANRFRRLAQQHQDDPIFSRQDWIVQSANDLRRLTKEYLLLADAGDKDRALAFHREHLEAGCAKTLGTALASAAVSDDWAITRTTLSITGTQSRVTALLSANAIGAFLLSAIGVLLVRNWVLKPVEMLAVATGEHANGNLSYRIEVRKKDELGNLSEAMNRMADSLMEIQKRLVQQERLAALGAVASIVAHNIRNPLAGIRASAQSAMNALPDNSAEYQQQRQIVETVDSLNQWIKQLLLVNRPLELHRRPTPVREMVEAVLATQRANAARRSIALRYDEPDGGCTVHVDPRHIEQAIQVLVDNALDASPTHGEVVLTAAHVPDSDRWVDLSVRDQGPGIPADVQDRIAAAYFTTKPGGTGIGLHLAKKAVESHGGEIRFDSPSGGGTSVTLRLPTRDLMGARDGQDSAAGR
ncbi:MAG: HAMP domain-containing histidine kinase [Phycisphaerae bacterium]|nr:HAMP domain-containing histidine kinase [Phycisphaerae bacterium]